MELIIYSNTFFRYSLCKLFTNTLNTTLGITHKGDEFQEDVNLPCPNIK